MPPQWSGLEVALEFRGISLQVRATHETVRVVASAPIDIELYDRPVHCPAGETILAAEISPSAGERPFTASTETTAGVDSADTADAGVGVERKETPMEPSRDDETAPRESATQPLSRCPTCGSPNLESVVETGRGTVHHLCRDCSRCWHVELGFVHRMTPDTCLGCPERGRCSAVYASDHAPDAT